MLRTGCEGVGGWVNELVDGNDEESREYWMIIGVWCWNRYSCFKIIDCILFFLLDSFAHSSGYIISFLMILFLELTPARMLLDPKLDRFLEATSLSYRQNKRRFFQICNETLDTFV